MAGCILSLTSAQPPAVPTIEPNVAAYEKLLAKVRIEGVQLVAVFTAQRNADGRQFYNAVTLEDGQEKPPAVSPRDTLDQAEERAVLHG